MRLLNSSSLAAHFVALERTPSAPGATVMLLTAGLVVENKILVTCHSAFGRS